MEGGPVHVYLTEPKICWLVSIARDIVKGVIFKFLEGEIAKEILNISVIL